jgi:type I restriction enzyme, R subunit
LDVLRKGIKDAGAKFDLVYFSPSTSMNDDYQMQYEGNVFSVIRQLYYKEGRKLSLDLGIFINGLPIFTVELKNPFTGQTVENAIYQYRNDRNPKEPLFKFGRCLGHFAVDPDLVYVTTHLKGKSTFFLPFNKGKYGGAGNVSVHDNFASHYLWEEIWTKDSLLNILNQFIHMIDVEDDKGNKTGEKLIIFPRYHQLDAVRRLIDDAKTKGSGQRYLIQHSAGSGKSYSIAWLAHQLSHLHDGDDKRVFDTVVVITDRRILDKQLQASIRQFEQVLGTVETIDDKKTSADLAKALRAGKQIIVSTLQKYPMIVNQISELQGANFVVIVDEAHSSQSGESVKSLKQVLSTGNLEEAGNEEEDSDPITWEDNIAESMRARQHQINISMFAFTATPKNKTLEIFGTRRPDGKFEPFSLYSMRQAIEEKFILDVLENYTTYTAYWRLLKKVDDDPEYESSKAKALLRRFVEMHRDNIDKKIEVIVEHFKDNVAKQIGGKAKAMIVTRSRLHALRYYLALKAYLSENNLPYGAMVAFSGTVEDDGIQFTESGMNGVSDKQTAKVFHRDGNRFLVVANKFQTGFDEPLLVAMYVDKLLSGVHAVQTLSRLNRQYATKDSTIVLDFANQADHIKESFQPYYEATLLSEATDHNLLYDRERELEEFHFYMQDEVDNFAQIYFTPSATQDQLHAPLDAVVERFDVANEDEQADFRSKLMDYIRLYAFLSQVIPFEDIDLEKLYVFAKFLRRKLPISRSQLPTEVLENIDIGSYRLQQLSSGSLTPERVTEELDPMLGGDGFGAGDKQHELLSQILEALNEIFGDNAEQALETMIEVKKVVVANSAVDSSVRINAPDKARLTVDDVALMTIRDLYKTNFDFYKRVNDDQYVQKFVLDWVFDEVLKEKDVGT